MQRTRIASCKGPVDPAPTAIPCLIERGDAREAGMKAGLSDVASELPPIAGCGVTPLVRAVENGTAAAFTRDHVDGRVRP